MDNPDTIISQFIDNELSLDEKKAFVERAHASREFKDEAVSLVTLEKRLRQDTLMDAPAVKPLAMLQPPRFGPMFRPLAIMTAVLVAAVAVLSFLLALQFAQPGPPYRFVIYEPDASRVDIAGSFTSWQRVPLARKGSSGYWEIVMDIPPGEHRFSYILDNGTRLADPTIPLREQDSFGGENSILLAGTQT